MGNDRKMEKKSGKIMEILTKNWENPTTMMGIWRKSVEKNEENEIIVEMTKIEIIQHCGKLQKNHVQ